MILIAFSSASKADWVLVDGDKIYARAVTEGLNPFFNSRRDLSHIIRLQLPKEFFRKRWEAIFFYGSGCSTAEKKKMVESSLISQFRSPTYVESDLLGAARGLLIRNKGLAAIIATGSNVCMYDGEDIVKNVRPGGYLLGDEGSASYIGKGLVSDIIKGLAPYDVQCDLLAELEQTEDEIIASLYGCRYTSRELAKYAGFVADHIDKKYCHDLVFDAFSAFFTRNVNQLGASAQPMVVLGDTATTFRPILQEVAKSHGYDLRLVHDDAIPGLILYHTGLKIL